MKLQENVILLGPPGKLGRNFSSEIYFYFCHQWDNSDLYKMCTRDAFVSRYIKKQELVAGETGKVSFDESGDRMNAEYDVINVHPLNRNSGVELVPVGKYLYSPVRVTSIQGTYHRS